nr:glutamate racemase [bacterium]
MENGGLVGFLDSGVGGTSVLALAERLLPGQPFLYLGDQKNNPYGEKGEQDIRRLVFEGLEHLLDCGAKALVLACNTATACAVDQARQRLPVPIIGMEPAIRPARQLAGDKPIAVLATPATLSLPRFDKLLAENGGQAYRVPCPGLVRMVEGGAQQGEMAQYVAGRLADCVPSGVVPGALVLGCTHFCFAREAISQAAPGVPLVDGNAGTVRQLARVLQKNGLLGKGGQTRVESTGDLAQERQLADMLARARRSLARPR